MSEADFRGLIESREAVTVVGMKNNVKSHLHPGKRRYAELRPQFNVISSIRQT